MTKKIFGSLVLFLVGMLIFVSCAKDTLVPAGSSIDPSKKISFKNDIQPIFTASCASCHSGIIAPNLLAGKAYSDLQAGGFINTGTPAQSIIYTEMAPGGGMSSHCTVTDADLVLAWITQGAKDN